MKWWKALIALLLLGGSVAVTLAGLQERPAPPVEVQLSEVKKGSITRTIAGAGKVRAARTVKISSNLSGDLVELPVKEGETVVKGQVLARIDRRRYEAMTKQAAAGVNASRADIRVSEVEQRRAAAELARVEALVNKGLASPAELERARADHETVGARIGAVKERVAQSLAGLEEIESDLSKTTLYSPLDGTIIELSREIGERVRGSDFSEDVVMVVAALEEMEVNIEVGEHEVVYLAPGKKAEIEVDALSGQVFEGVVTEIAHKALVKNQGTEAEVTTFPVTVALVKRPPGALPGMSAEVRILAETHEDIVLVPVQAVTVRPERGLQRGPDKDKPEGAQAATAEEKPAEAKDDKAGDDKPKDDKAGDDKSKDDKAGDDKPKDDKAGDDKPKDDKAGDDKTKDGKKGKGPDKLVKVVFVVVDGKVSARKVETGIASDNEVEVTSGLVGGEKVVEGPYRTLARELKDGDAVTEEGEGGPEGGGKGKWKKRRGGD